MDTDTNHPNNQFRSLRHFINVAANRLPPQFMTMLNLQANPTTSPGAHQTAAAYRVPPTLTDPFEEKRVYLLI